MSKTKKNERDEFHLKALTPIGAIGIRKKGDTEALAALSKNETEGAEHVSATPRPDNPRVLDLRPAYATTKGPAQVATDEYRRSYDRIFGKPKTKKYTTN